jgi:6-phosphogluconolactonase (cycloisomerase 2 family)
LARALQLAGVGAGLAGALALPARADTATGCNLTFGAAYIDDGENFDGLNDATAVATHGTSIYVVSNVDNSIVSITRQGDNSLVFADFVKDNVFPVDGLDKAAGVAVTSDGAYVYVAAGGSDKAVTGFAVSGGNLLSLVNSAADSDGLAGASGVAVAPDGENVYATGATSDAVVAFTRNTSNGELTFLNRVKNGSFGLDGASAVAVSPDGNHVYVTGKLDNAIAQFSRHATTGALSWVETQAQGINMADCLNGVTALAISPDGAFVYTASSTDGKIGKFTRNTTTGELDFAAVAASGLSGLSALAISSDGAQLYATSWSASTNGTLRVYGRNTTTGDLSNDTTVSDFSTDDATKMRQPTSVAVTADGQHVYVTSRKDNAIDTFLAFTPSGTTCEAGNLCTADTCNGSGTCVTGSCQLGNPCIDPSCAGGLCDNTGGPCICKKTE